jgi:hypothetical protein
MARGKGYHKWRWIGTGASMRGTDVLLFACERCGRQKQSNEKAKVGPCIYRQMLIEWEPDPWLEQMQRLNQTAKATG